MKLATERTDSPDGRLLVVSRDLRRVVPAVVARTLQDALERWETVSPSLERLYATLNEGDVENASDFNVESMAAPLPRAWQWLDGSVFANHGDLMQKAFNLPPIETDKPLMYQGLSHQFLSATDDVLLPSEADGIDFEGEFGIITGSVPMGTPVESALKHVRLIALVNDWSLRVLAPAEMKTGFGWVQAKPACALSAVVVTPDELGPGWVDGRVRAIMHAELNGVRFGSVLSDQMAFGFDDLIAHAAYSRSLSAGTIIGSGTVSSTCFRDMGSCCIAERRAIEMIDSGRPQTPFMRFGDRIKLDASVDGVDGPLFGSIDQRVQKAPGHQVTA